VVEVEAEMGPHASLGNKSVMIYLPIELVTGSRRLGLNIGRRQSDREPDHHLLPQFDSSCLLNLLVHSPDGPLHGVSEFCQPPPVTIVVDS